MSQARNKHDAGSELFSLILKMNEARFSETSAYYMALHPGR
jgi:hypothetical protein